MLNVALLVVVLGVVLFVGLAIGMSQHASPSWQRCPRCGAMQGLGGANPEPRLRGQAVAPADSQGARTDAATERPGG